MMMRSVTAGVLGASVLASPAFAQIFDFESGSSAEYAFDGARNILLISTSDGEILRFDVDSQSFLAPIDVGGTPFGLDVTPDGSTLFVAQSTPGSSVTDGTTFNTVTDVFLHRIDLDSLAQSDLELTVTGLEQAPFDVATGSAGVGLFTTNFAGSGWNPFRQIDLATNEISVRTDLSSVRQSTYLDVSEDHRYILIQEYNTSSAPLHVYDSATDSIISSGSAHLTSGFNFGRTAINSSAGLVASSANFSLLVFDLNLSLVQDLGELNTNRQIEGVTFAPDGNLLYILDIDTDEIIAVNTSTFGISERYSLISDVEDISSGNQLIISDDGTQLYVDLGTGFEVLDFLTYEPACDATIEGDGGVVTCSIETARSYFNSFSNITVDILPTAALSGSTALGFGGFDVALNNAGVIEGTISFAVGESDDVIVNSGTIAGRVTFGEGDDELVNAEGGVISSFVDMGGGDDQVLLEAGSVVGETGAVSLGAGDDNVIVEDGAVVDGVVDGGFSSTESGDALILRGGSVDLNRFTSFETAEIDVDGAVGVEGVAVVSQSVSVDRGELQLRDGTLATNELTIGPNASLTGAGLISFTFGALANSIQVDGVLAPTPSDGGGDASLVIAGDLTLSETSTLQASFVSAGDLSDNLPPAEGVSYGSVSVTGDATLEGGDLQIDYPEGSAPPIGEFSFEVVEAGGEVVGEFGDVTAPANYSVSDVQYTDDSVRVSFHTDLGSGADMSAPSDALAGYLNDLAVTTDQATTESVVQSLVVLDPDSGEVDAALRELAPEPYASAHAVGRNLAVGVIDTLSGRAPASPTDRRRRLNRSSTAWVAGTGSMGWAGGGGSTASRTNVDTSGALFGVDHEVADGLQVGGFFGAASFDQEFDDFAASTKGDSFTGGAQVRLRRDAGEGEIIVGYVSADAKTDRVLTSLGSASRAEYDVEATFASVAVSGSVPVPAGIELRPHVRATMLDLERGPVEELSDSDASFTLAAQDNRYLYADIGLSGSVEEGMIGGRVHPFVEGGYRFELLNDAPVALASLNGESSGYAVSGLELARGLAYSGAGLSVKITDGISATAGYRGELAEDFSRQSAQIVVEAEF